MKEGERERGRQTELGERIRRAVGKDVTKRGRDRKVKKKDGGGREEERGRE